MLDPNKVRVGPLLGGVIALLLAIFLLFSLFVDVETNEVVVVKYPTGDLQCYTEAGPQLQLFGSVTRYPRRGTIDFSEIGTKEEPGNAKTIRFNDGGHGQLAGSVQYEMPLDCTSVTKIHRAFGSQAGVESNAIGKMVDNAIYFAGPLMSSTESAGERRDVGHRPARVRRRRRKGALTAMMKSRVTWALLALVVILGGVFAIAQAVLEPLDDVGGNFRIDRFGLAGGIVLGAELR